MSANFYDLLKCAATGIASPSMTYYDRMRASMLMGGAVQTLTGVPPLSFKANGKPLISWSMKGNGQQTGTPTPDAPIMPEFVGVRTWNLVDIKTFQDGMHLDKMTGLPTSYDGRRIATMQPIDVSQYSNVTLTFSEITHRAAFMYSLFNGDALIERAANKQSGDTIDTSNATRMYLSLYFCIVPDVIYIMLNSGSTALPYEPFGWAEKITCAGQTTPVYLGQVSTVRKIGKLVLDGTEPWESASGYAFKFSFTYAHGFDQNTIAPVYCSHYIAKSYADVYNGRAYGISVRYGSTPSTRGFAISKGEITALADFKSYLAAQYAAGHPVTIWYVLATPETAIVNEPLAKIGDYADELHSEDAGVTIPTAKGQNTLTVGTDLQPSEMMIVYQN